MYRLWILSSLALILVGVTASAQTRTAQTAPAQPGAGTQEKSQPKVAETEPLTSGSVFQFTMDGSYLGVFVEEVTPERMKDLGLAQERGAIVMKVVKDSPAEKAGFKENDVIVTFNGR